MGKKTVNFLKLLQEKKYSLIVSIIENDEYGKERNQESNQKLRFWRVFVMIFCPY